MATYKTYDTIGIREDLQNAIYDISPTTTPFMSTIGKTTAKNTYHEWQTDSLASVDKDNAKLEGADAVAPTLTPTKRVGNYTQISDKVVQVSTTDDKVDKAGRSTETAYQLAKASAELKRDMESILLSDQEKNEGGASVASGDAMSPRKLGGFQSWLTTNVVAGAGAFTEQNVKDAMLKAYTEGGEPTMLLVSPAQKQVISTFEGIAGQRYEAPKSSPTTIIGTADVYLSDFGTLNVVPDRFLDDDVALIVDPSMVNVAYLRPFKQTKLAKTGDFDKHMMNVEYTLVVKNEAAHAMVTDLTV
jgi:hypothetical protein